MPNKFRGQGLKEKTAECHTKSIDIECKIVWILKISSFNICGGIVEQFLLQREPGRGQLDRGVAPGGAGHGSGGECARLQLCVADHRRALT